MTELAAEVEGIVAAEKTLRPMDVELSTTSREEEAAKDIKTKSSFFDVSQAFIQNKWLPWIHKDGFHGVDNLIPSSVDFVSLFLCDVSDAVDFDVEVSKSFSICRALGVFLTMCR